MNEQLKIIISAEIDKLKKGIQDAKGEIDSLSSESASASADIDGNFKKIGDGVKSAMSKVGTAIAAGVVALAGIAVATKDYQTEQAKLNAAFTTAGAAAGVATQVYNDLYRVLGESDTSVEAANHLAQLTTNEKDLAEWTNICQGVYATFGDSLPIEGLTEAANETAKTGVVTGQLADALNWAGISEDEFNQKLAACNSEAEREELIRTTLNGIYSDAAAEYEKTAAGVLAQNEAQAKLQATLANIGAALAPLVAAFINFGANVLSIVVPYIQQLAEQYGPTLQTVLEGIATALQNAFTWASEHKALLMVIGGIIMTVVTAIGLYNTVAAIKAAMAAAEVASVWALVAAYAAQAAAMIVALAPYLLIAAAIAAVIAIIVLCIKHWDKIKAKVVEVTDKIKAKVQEMVDKVVKFFEDLKTKISNKVEEIKTKIQEKFEAIKYAIQARLEAAKQVVTTIFEAIKSVIENKINTAKTIISNVISLIKGIFSGDFGAVKQSVANIMGAVVDSFKNKMNTAKTAVKNAINAIKGFFNFKWSLPKLKMPSIKITGKFSLNPPSAPKFSISWNKLGGIFDKPTLFNYGGSLQGIGEDGAEAVVPLEKNTQWLDRLAERLSAKQNGIPIVLQVDGKTFAQVSIDSINALTKQRGTLGLNLV